MTDLQEQGRACYKQGDYKKAVALFDRAIGRSPSVQLLDNRAACYEKLGDFSAALKDAKKAIQLHREDALGYLRAGRVLGKMEKQRVALEIYTHGLKSIKHVGQGYEQLRKMHKELMDHLCPPISVDPMTVLPRELAESVLEYLNFRQRMNACLVSKQWAQLIRSIPSLWSHLDLTGARRKVRTTFVSRVINTARTKLRAATLNNLYDFNKTLSALLKHCTLEELTLLDCGLQGENLTSILTSARALRNVKITQGTRINSNELRSLMSALSSRLESLDCCAIGYGQPAASYHVRCPALKFLSLTFDGSFNDRALFQYLPERFPGLETLIFRHNGSIIHDAATIDLKDCTQLRRLELHVRLANAEHLRIPAGLKTLKLYLQFSFNPPFLSIPDLDELSIGPVGTFRSVTRVLDNYPAIDPPEAGEGGDTSQRSGLRSFTLVRSSCDDRIDVGTLLSHPRLRGLQHLGLQTCLGVDDAAVAAISSAKLDSLRSVDLTSATLTGVGVKDLVSSLKLESLIVDECRNVSPDAVEWARWKGVAVKHRISNEMAGGKKVRY